eukprot:TRINITY_DN14731_c0_g1_i1.p1 TRINITY_DN14731_c0_g1~~TRINITY_DN14731_c0_g1_i1.p1  ORF type:complete len:318 (-),score=60.70 TRINITY_DN14731_c0_g1_i1:117-1070(-)
MEIDKDAYVSLALLTLILAISVIWYFAVGAGKSASQSDVAIQKKQRHPPVESKLGERSRGPAAESSVKAPSSDSASASRAAAATGAAQAAESAALKTKSAEQYLGVVKRYSDRNGMGFLACTRTREKYNCDIRIYREEYEAAGLSVGACVSFHTAFGGRPNCPKGQPWATQVQRLPDGTVPEPEPRPPREKAVVPPRQAQPERSPAHGEHSRERRSNGGASLSSTLAVPEDGAVEERMMESQLKAEAPPFVPSASAVAAAVSTTPVPVAAAPARGLQASAPEFRPMSLAHGEAAVARQALSSRAPEFVPTVGARALG